MTEEYNKICQDHTRAYFDVDLCLEVTHLYGGVCLGTPLGNKNRGVACVAGVKTARPESSKSFQKVKELKHTIPILDASGQHRPICLPILTVRLSVIAG